MMTSASISNTPECAGSDGVRSLCALPLPVDRSPRESEYLTDGGILVQRSMEPIELSDVLDDPRSALDNRRGGIFTSNYEYPDRYRRFDLSFVDPPLVLEGRGRAFTVRALNSRGLVLLPAIERSFTVCDQLRDVVLNGDRVVGEAHQPPGSFSEEERSRQPSIFSVLRALHELFGSQEDPHLGLYGAFGYDLVFQFDPIPLRLPRGGEPDLVLYLPDELMVADRPREICYRVRYNFSVGDATTKGKPRGGEQTGQVAISVPAAPPECDHAPGEYQRVVELVREGCRRGDFFEVVPGQTFALPCAAAPSDLFQLLCKRNPSPYGFFLNLGEQCLVGASPEMFIRVEGSRVETCPISGTIARGGDAFHDARQIRDLLNSEKDEAELTMCTDVDRNDKSRICVPGSVRVLGRRQVEMYSRVIHTVDHVEGTLQPGRDALDAFLSHTWAVTLTGAPKRAAMEFIENVEKTPRRFYGGAVGFFTFNGNMNTGITIRTIRLHDGIAEVRAGATLLYDSIPDDEEKETRAKASAMLDVVRLASRAKEPVDKATSLSPLLVPDAAPARKARVLLVDHEDSFVHTLANYVRQAGAEVLTLRAPVSLEILREHHPDLVFLSPGPGRPADFHVPELVRLCASLHLPTFGVCLGLQGMVEAFGGELGILPEPVHGKGSLVTHTGHALFDGVPGTFRAGRYHSLYATRVPDELQVIATSDDGVVMAVAHRELPMTSVQFHPESILSQEGDCGLRLIQNVINGLARGNKEHRDQTDSSLLGASAM